MAEKVNSYAFKNTAVFISCLLIAAPLFSYPLAWLKLFYRKVMIWGEVQAVMPEVLGVLALAALCMAPERIRKLWQVPRLRWLMFLSLAGIGTAVCQQFIYGGPLRFICSSGFFFLLPLAGAVYSSELKRFFPIFAALLFIPALWATCYCFIFSGLVGNWNWNFSLLSLTLSSIFFLIPHWSVSKAAWCSLGGVVLLLLFFTLWHPEYAPRGTFAGVIGATVCVLVFRNIRPSKRWIFALWFVVITVVLFAGTVDRMTGTVLNSRFQLWRGGMDFALAHQPLGTGPDRFESMINPYLPDMYHFTQFASPRHTHPHNELLNYAGCYGVAGVLFFAILLLLILRGIRLRDRFGLLIGCGVLLLAVHGQFDVLLGVPLTGSWFLLGAGILAGNGLTKCQTPEKHSRSGNLLRFAGFIVGAVAVVMAAVSCHGTWYWRKARLALMKKDAVSARKFLKKSFTFHTSPAALYTAGAVELFNFRDPDGAIFYLDRISSEFGLPAVYHSNALLGRAFAVKGDYERSLYYLDEELKNYPFSAVASWLRLSVLRQAGADKQVIAAENARFISRMKMRGLSVTDLPVLLRHQELDDKPLKYREKH